jgi:hypothetical protein
MNEEFTWKKTSFYINGEIDGRPMKEAGETDKLLMEHRGCYAEVTATKRQYEGEYSTYNYSGILTIFEDECGPKLVLARRNGDATKIWNGKIKTWNGDAQIDSINLKGRE